MVETETNHFIILQPLTETLRVSMFMRLMDLTCLTWLPHKWRCSDTENEYIPIHDFVLLGLYGETGYETGAWCSYPGTKHYPYICEGLI